MEFILKLMQTTNADERWWLACNRLPRHFPSGMDSQCWTTCSPTHTLIPLKLNKNVHLFCCSMWAHARNFKRLPIVVIIQTMSRTRFSRCAQLPHQDQHISDDSDDNFFRAVFPSPHNVHVFFFFCVSQFVCWVRSTFREQFSTFSVYFFLRSSLCAHKSWQPIYACEHFFFFIFISFKLK